MTHQQRLENPLYTNWVRGALGLGYLKEGLCDFVDTKTKEQHQELIANVNRSQPSFSQFTRVCDHCTLDNLLPDHASLGKKCIQMIKSKCFCNSRQGRRKCPNGICSRMYDLIVDGHFYRDPLWKNTNPELWCTDHWSIAKCFLTNPSQTTLAKDTDASGLLGIITNNLFLQKELATTICSNDPALKDSFTKAREARNEILHSPTLELQDFQMNAYINTFIDVLSDKKYLVHDAAAQNAIRNLSQLKSSQIYINLKNELQIRKDALQALEEKKSEALNEIDSAQTEALRILQAQCNVRKETEADTRASIAESNEKHTQITSQLRKIEATQRIKGKELHQMDKRLKRSEALQLELEEKVDLNQENIQKQIETVKTRQNAQEQVLSQLAVQMKALQQKINDMKTSNTDLHILKDKHKQNIETLTRQADLQTELITLYQQYYLKTDVSPLLPEEDVDVDEVFVPLKMERLYKPDQKDLRRGDPVYFFKDIFFHGETRFRNIFLTADAGVGKTTFCRKLTSTWCKVHSRTKPTGNLLNVSTQRSKFRTKENIESRNKDTMIKFTYLFYVSLRHTNEEKTIEEMIRVQLLTERNRDLLITILEEQPDSCLVILDGLDEWNAPLKLPKSPFITSGLPDKEVKRPYVTLYTTRPWKLENIRPKSGEVDIEIKLMGIDAVEAGKLANTVVEKLNKSTYTSVNVEDFIQALELKELKTFESTPILLKLLACLWHEEQSLGASLCGIYCSVLELLLRVAIERNSNDDLFMKTLNKLQTAQEQSLPTLTFFQNKSICKTLIEFLKLLAKCAFKALFESTQKAALVFEGTDLSTFGISQEEMQFCLKTGIMSQRLLPGISVINRCRSVTFIHKTFQEFFAALYVVTSNDELALDTVLRVCNSVEKVLEMGKVIQFIGGMCPSILYNISEHIAKLTDEDARFKAYRSVDSSMIYIVMIQDLLFSSIKESLDCGHTELPQFKLRDVHLWNEDTNECVLYVDPCYIKSLSSNSCITTDMKTHISETQSLKLIFFSGLFGEFPKKEFFDIVEKSCETLVCLVIKTANIERQGKFNFPKLHTLTKIVLSDVTLDHSTMICLLSGSPHLHECFAMCVYCFKDENCQCNSTSTKEEPIVNLVSTNVHRFECRFGCNLFRHVRKAENLSEICVANLKDPETMTDIARIIQTSKALKTLQIHGITSEIMALPLPSEPNTLRSIQLSEISVRMIAVLNIIEAAQKTDDSFVMKFDNVTLTTGRIDEMKEVVGRSKTFQIDSFRKRYKIKGNFKRPKYKNSPGSEAVFSMVLSKANRNK
ncbi:uncharacterized protein LOC123551515 [Mercenaria mercenaria]|uniref:uncharacterized protein LOC123551515 n=1 Tax=Mercenaria mercenaria TaxID=6596 RepID=UPI00234E3A7C|nr:uncharacterized protein LOC123551515 [Mercenaria mercenaria]XP_045196440.2 uncharacterized protein LOC123551515 [Mercenaria mercenaria]